MGRLRRIRPIALIVGWVVDIGGSNVMYLVLFGVLAGVGRISTETLSSSEELSRLLTDPSSEIFWLGTAGGTAMSVLAGYVAARVAGHDEVLHGVLASLGSVLFSLPLPQSPLLTANPILAVALLALGFAASGVGGWIRLKTMSAARPVLT
jgi:hypothetical protein